MTKFEEEVKRPDNTGIDPFSKRDVDFSKLAAKFTRGAQTLKNWRNYADYLENKIDRINDNLLLETQQSAIYHAEIVEQKRENQRLKAENLAVKTLVDDAKQQQALPVVPDDVAKWIEHCKGMGYGLIAALTFKLSSTMHEELSAKILKWLGNEGNDETFALAFITGKYQIEKPQLFYLKNTLTHEYLYRKYKTSLGEQSYCKGTDGKPLDYCLFTLDEIESMNTGSYEQIEVTE